MAGASDAAGLFRFRGTGLAQLPPKNASRRPSRPTRETLENSSLLLSAAARNRTRSDS
jgi:hypothetical protein